MLRRLELSKRQADEQYLLIKNNLSSQSLTIDTPAPVCSLDPWLQVGRHHRVLEYTRVLNHHQSVTEETIPFQHGQMNALLCTI